MMKEEVTNPWLEIPLEEYEEHMSSPTVAQAQYLTAVLKGLVQSLSPSSVAVLGCAGGNGFEMLSAYDLRRVVGVDMNPDYIAAARKRYEHRFSTLDLFCYDFLSRECLFEPVDFVFAGLIFEYIDVEESLQRIKGFLVPNGYLGVVLQLPSATVPHLTPSPFKSLMKLENFMKLVSPTDFENQARSSGFVIRSANSRTLETGKAFYEGIFQRNKGS
ncbi:MAG TPA: class I SAM-dependent methyltransferase [Bacteroidota bacterium]|nr:class I SAM-dependent methyltransferase [Bacteroidota bacterium]